MLKEMSDMEATDKPDELRRQYHELAELACALRMRVERPVDSRYRLVGVGLAGFVDADSCEAQRDLFINN